MPVYPSIGKLELLKIPQVQRIFLDVMQNIVDSATIDEMIKAIEANDSERLLKAAGFSAAALTPFLDAIDQVYQDSAETTVSTWPSKIPTTNGPVVFRFDMRNVKAEQDLKTISSSLISQITEGARQNVRDTLQQGMINGDNPRTTALNIVGRIDPVTKQRIGGVIGLAGNQSQWVMQTQRMLENLDPRYFDRVLRDKRFDSIVKKAIDSGIPLSVADIERLTTAYKNNVLKYRGETIARTETIQTLNKGEHAANMQLVEQGLISHDAITKEWDDVGDRKVRPSHRFLAEKYNSENGIPIDQPFETESGTQMMYPGDSSLGAGAEEIANCRCREKIKINWLLGVE